MAAERLHSTAFEAILLFIFHLNGSRRLLICYVLARWQFLGGMVVIILVSFKCLYSWAIFIGAGRPY